MNYKWDLCLTDNLENLLCFISVNGRYFCIVRLKCDDTRAETRFRLSAKPASPFKSTAALVHSTTVIEM